MYRLVIPTILAATSALADPPPGTYESVRLLVELRSGLAETAADAELRAVGGARTRLMRNLHVHAVDLPVGTPAEATVIWLKQSKKFSVVEQDRKVELAATYPLDPQYSKSWHLPKVGAPRSWDTAQGAGVTIAILDTGVDDTHPDLKANIVAGQNVYDNNTDTHDVYGHGTQVAGVAAAANNSSGSVGVAYKAKIMPVRVSDPQGYAYWSTVAQGIYWAADHGARVANVSYNGIAGSSTVQSAAQYMRSKGGVVVVAAGNAGKLESIAPSDSLIVVSATDQSDNLASFSSFGPYVTVAAPGVGIYTTARGGGYSTPSGTSFSSPLVAGAVALIMSANPLLTPTEVTSMLTTAVWDYGTTGRDDKFGYGRIRPWMAVEEAHRLTNPDDVKPLLTIVRPLLGLVSGLVNVDVVATDNQAVAHVDLYVNGQLVANDPSEPYSFAFDAAQFPGGCMSLTVKAFDTAGNVTTQDVPLLATR